MSLIMFNKIFCSFAIYVIYNKRFLSSGKVVKFILSNYSYLSSFRFKRIYTFDINNVTNYCIKGVYNPICKKLISYFTIGLGGKDFMGRSWLISIYICRIRHNLWICNNHWLVSKKVPLFKTTVFLYSNT